MELKDYIDALLKIKNNKKILPFLLNEVPGEVKYGKPHMDQMTDPTCDAFPDETYHLRDGDISEGCAEFMYDYVDVESVTDTKQVIQIRSATVAAMLAVGITPIIKFVQDDEDPTNNSAIPLISYDMGDFIAD